MSFCFSPFRNKPHAAQSGFTMVEVIIALTILVAGSGVLWYGIQSAGKVEMLNRLHHAAVLAARSDLEGLHGVAKRDIHDTSYFAAGTAAESLLVVRQVMDSARILNTLSEIVLDEKLSPKELRKPLEVQVKVYRDEQLETSREKRLLISLTLKLPEYKWY